MNGPGPISAASGTERSAEVARRALQRLTLSGALRTVDAALADLLRRLGAGPEVALAGALAMRAVAQGDSGFTLTRAEALLAALDASATLPEPDAWREALRASRWVALSVGHASFADTRHEGEEGEEFDEFDGPASRPWPAAASGSPGSPLLVFEHDRVALLRYARFEHDLAHRLLERHGGSADARAHHSARHYYSRTPTVLAADETGLGSESAEPEAWPGAASESESGTPTSSRTPTVLMADEIGHPAEPAGSAAQSATTQSESAPESSESRTPIDLITPGDTHPHTLARLRRLFALPGFGTDADPGVATLDRQALAAWLALRRHLLLLTGGPGTGKTTTVARLLALAVEDARARGQPTPRIALAAPTGRAAARLAEAVGAQLARDLADGRLDAALAAAVPRQASTLHRLLGVRPGELGFRHHAQRPLPFDLVVVDEASMIDLPLMERLVAAVASEARLVLIGDPDQLPAVEAGDVLGALCAAAGDGLAVAAADAQAANRALGVPVPVAVPVLSVPVSVPFPAVAISAPSSAAFADPMLPTPAGDETETGSLPLAGARVQLVYGWRQAGAAPLQAFAAAVRSGDADAALAQLPARVVFAGDSLDDGVFEDDSRDISDIRVHALQRLHGDPAALAAWLRSWALPVFAAVRDADTAEEALALAQRLRLLTALRRGPFGADTWNAWCAAELGARGRWFHGALIAIAANSRHHGLYNGDLGVIRRARDGSLKAWFALQEAGGETRWRGWRPAQLPAHGLAFATTVHKAQGSEFERVALILPDRDTRALGRELLYTAATRARRALWLWAAPERVREAVERPAVRDSGLLARLRAGG